MLKPGIQKLSKQTVRDLAVDTYLLHEIAEKAMHGELFVVDDADLQEKLIGLGKALEDIEWPLQCRVESIQVEV